ncbi:TIGR00341 family protein [Lebetimonas sp. JS032]|uniref:TIGR00341 family protein n=1 Tax=Lebetimonas sp. JS032 TaxID=990070 RepID=UPI0004666D2F|nr:TIGR00341 family protein [Lebetimonas sp. JS032]
MELRLIEAVLPKEKKEDIQTLLSKENIVDFWREEIVEDKIIFQILVDATLSEKLIDKLSRKFSKDERFRIVSMDVKTTLPLPQQEISKTKHIRVSIPELYNAIVSSIEINYIFITMIVLSTIIAAFGLYKNSGTIIIGAMVIAPLLSPNIAVSFATVLGDLELEKKGIAAFLIGCFIALLLSVATGFFLNIDVDNFEIKSRIAVNYPDLIIAFVSGVAGTLAFTTGQMMGLVGVMVAISLLPPLVNTGLLISNGYFLYAIGSFLLFLANFASLNLAGVLTFLFQGVKPRKWWEEKKAKEHRIKAIILWMILIFILIFAIFAEKKFLAKKRLFQENKIYFFKK